MSFLENNLIFHDGELEKFKEGDEEEFVEEMWEDEEPLHNAIAAAVEHSTIYRSRLIMVSPREAETFLDFCLIMTYLCQETDNEFFTHKIREDTILVPNIFAPGEFSRYTIGSGIVEDICVYTPYYLFPP